MCRGRWCGTKSNHHFASLHIHCTNCCVISTTKTARYERIQIEIHGNSHLHCEYSVAEQSIRYRWAPDYKSQERREKLAALQGLVFSSDRDQKFSHNSLNGEETANPKLSLWSLRLAYLIYNHELLLHWNCPTCLHVQSSLPMSTRVYHY